MRLKPFVIAGLASVIAGVGLVTLPARLSYGSDREPMKVYLTGKSDLPTPDAAEKAALEKAGFPYEYKFSTAKDVADSVADLQEKLKDTDLVQQAGTADDAELLLEVLGRAARRVNLQLDTRLLLRVSAGPRLDPALLKAEQPGWKGSFTVKIKEMHPYTPGEPYWDVEMRSLGNWGAHAKGVAKAMDNFIKNNHAALVAARRAAN